MALCQSALAAYHLQDGFNYLPGILGTNAPWTNPTNLITVVNGGLTYANLADFAPPGGAVSVTQGSSPSATVSYRAFDSFATNGSAYFSFLIEFTNVNASSYIAGLLSSIGLPGGKASDPCDLYVRSATGGYNLGVAAKGGNTVYGAAVLVLNTVYFVVLKYEFATGRASFYLNPSPGASEPASPDATSAGMAVTALKCLYLRVSGPVAGGFLLDAVRVASTWAEVTPLGEIAPATRLVFATEPTSGTAGAALASTVVQIQNETGFHVPSNGVPVTLTLNPGGFAGGTTTVNTDIYGRATFNDLVVGLPGTYTLTASASGIGAGLASATSGPIMIGATNITQAGQALSVFLDSLQVEQYWDNGKHVNWLTGAPGGTGTNMTTGDASHCSAFAAAVAKLLDVYILRPHDASDMGLANNQADWLATNRASGWLPIPSPVDAQHIANAGGLVVASLKEQPPVSGHIAVIRPSTKSDAEILARGPQECQSGIINYNSVDVMTGFGQHDGLERILYYGHEVTNEISPVYSALGHGACPGGAFSFPAISIVGRRYKLQHTSDFIAWSDLLSFTNSNEGEDFYCVTPLIDAPSLNPPRRFYRLLSQ